MYGVDRLLWCFEKIGNNVLRELSNRYGNRRSKWYSSRYTVTGTVAATVIVTGTMTVTVAETTNVTVTCLEVELES
jgi:hypothetical protein